MANKVPKLICLVTGVMRVTTREYLDAKMAKKGISEEEFCNHYARKDAMKLLRDGKTVDQVRAELKSDLTAPISPDVLAKIMLYNGKMPKPKIVAAPVTAAPAVIEAGMTEATPEAVSEPALTIEQSAAEVVNETEQPVEA